MGLEASRVKTLLILIKWVNHGHYFYNDDLITISMFIESKSQDLDIPLANDQ